MRARGARRGGVALTDGAQAWLATVALALATILVLRLDAEMRALEKGTDALQAGLRAPELLKTEAFGGQWVLTRDKAKAEHEWSREYRRQLGKDADPFASDPVPSEVTFSVSAEEETLLAAVAERIADEEVAREEAIEQDILAGLRAAAAGASGEEVAADLTEEELMQSAEEGEQAAAIAETAEASMEAAGGDQQPWVEAAGAQEEAQGGATKESATAPSGAGDAAGEGLGAQEEGDAELEEAGEEPHPKEHQQPPPPPQQQPPPPPPQDQQQQRDGETLGVGEQGTLEEGEEKRPMAAGEVQAEEEALTQEDDFTQQQGAGFGFGEGAAEALAEQEQEEEWGLGQVDVVEEEEEEEREQGEQQQQGEQVVQAQGESADVQEQQREESQPPPPPPPPQQQQIVHRAPTEERAWGGVLRAIRAGDEHEVHVEVAEVAESEAALLAAERQRLELSVQEELHKEQNRRTQPPAPPLCGKRRCTPPLTCDIAAEQCRCPVVMNGGRCKSRHPKLPEWCVKRLQTRLEWQESWGRRMLNDTTSCAVVGSAITLMDKDHGAEIDTHSVVIRLNSAPTEGYERHVGSKTTVRVQDQSNCGYQEREPVDGDEQICLLYEPLQLGTPEYGECEQRMQGCARTAILPDSAALYTAEQWVRTAVPGVARGGAIKASPEFFAVSLALNVCSRVELYGFAHGVASYHAAPPSAFEHTYNLAKENKCMGFLAGHARDFRGTVRFVV